MSNTLKKKKKKKDTYSAKIGTEKTTEIQRKVNDCFERVFQSMQLCSWYVLYGPEYFDWDYEQMKKFSDKMGENNVKFGKKSSEYENEVKTLSEKIGINIAKEAEIFPYRVKIKMYGRIPKKNEISAVIMYMNETVKSALFLIIYTIYHDFFVSAEDIRERFLPNLLEISWNYAKGMNDGHLMKYFKEIEGWDIFDYEEEG